MPSLQSSTFLATISKARQPFFLPRSTPIYYGSTRVRTYAQGYGDGNGDPRSENPQSQGKSNTTKENAEHPGPKAPSENSGKTPEDSSAQSGGSRSKEAKETGSSPTGGSVGKSEGQNGSSPKISDKSVPGKGNSRDKQAEVEEHNKEFEERYDRAPPAEGDKVDKKFWSGHGGSR